MKEEPEYRVVKVPTIPIHPSVLSRYEELRAELERLLTPKALAELDAEEHAFLFGTDQRKKDA